MATAKLNKDKLKRMMEQKDAVSINLGKKRRGDSASKPSSDEVVVRPPVIPESAPVVQVLLHRSRLLNRRRFLYPAGLLTSPQLWLWTPPWLCVERNWR